MVNEWIGERAGNASRLGEQQTLLWHATIISAPPPSRQGRICRHSSRPWRERRATSWPDSIGPHLALHRSMRRDERDFPGLNDTGGRGGRRGSVIEEGE